MYGRYVNCATYPETSFQPSCVNILMIHIIPISRTLRMPKKNCFCERPKMLQNPFRTVSTRDPPNAEAVGLPCFTDATYAAASARFCFSVRRRSTARQNPHSLVANVQGCVVVAVDDRATVRASPLPVPQGQFGIVVRKTTATEVLLQELPLLPVRVDAELIGPVDKMATGGSTRDRLPDSCSQNCFLFSRFH